MIAVPGALLSARTAGVSGALTLRVPDPDRKLIGVRLVHDVRIAGRLLDFRRGADDWELTCGAIEENAPNNRLMTRVLREHGYDATLHEVADVHNYTAWRDSFDPHLTRLLRRMGP